SSFDFEDEITPPTPAFDTRASESTATSELSFDFDDEDEDIPDIGELLDEDDDEEPAFIPPENRIPEINEYRKMFSVFADDEEDEEESHDEPEFSAANDLVFEEEDEVEEVKPDKRPLFSYGDDLNEDAPPFEAVSKPAPKAEKVEREYERPDYSTFKFPPIDMLQKGHEDEDPTIEEEINENGDKLIDSLAQFDVKASIKSVDRGPRITRYEIVPARGVRVQRVISLFDDIALNLAAEGIRMEAPIPGKSAIGVEIPNKHPSTVYLRDLIESDEFMCEPSKTFACFGKDVTGNPVFGDIAKMPHILIAGATGMGKSVCINSILISILYKARPDEVKFIMVDPKTVEFTMYNGIPHLLVPVVTDAKQAAGALMWAIDEMNRRYELMAKHEVRKLDSYNDIVREHPELGEPLPKIIIVIDELNDLMQQVRKPVEGLITNITQKARAAGIHMIIGTQRPSVDVITGVIKANVPSRVSCKVTSLTDSRTILDQAGAEKLLDKGDMLYAPVGKPKPVRVQGAFVADAEVEKIMKFLKSNVNGAIYDEKALEEMTRAAAKCNKGKDADDEIDEDGGAEEGAGYLSDKQFLEAVDLAIKQGKISTSLIQRKISVGYGKAAKFIDIMEGLGVVSEPNGQKPRDVLVTKTEWQEMLSRRSLDD
ncbi:MAG: DNA translocase FtsK, partial [Clostridia bacterium]|nr:DNA translocase FtsK [Clostridia bacterium]